MNTIRNSVNVDGVVVLLGGGEDTSTLNYVSCLNLFYSEVVGTQKPSFQLPCPYALDAGKTLTTQALIKVASSHPANTPWVVGTP